MRGNKRPWEVVTIKGCVRERFFTYSLPKGVVNPSPAKYLWHRRWMDQWKSLPVIFTTHGVTHGVTSRGNWLLEGPVAQWPPVVWSYLQTTDKDHLSPSRGGKDIFKDYLKAMPRWLIKFAVKTTTWIPEIITPDEASTHT